MKTVKVHELSGVSQYRVESDFSATQPLKKRLNLFKGFNPLRKNIGIYPRNQSINGSIIKEEGEGYCSKNAGKC